MSEFIRSLFNQSFLSIHLFKIKLFSLAKSALLLSLLPFIYISLFIPLFTFLESLIYSVSYFFGHGLLFLFINMFWSVHVNLCVSIILSLKLTLYFNYLYSHVRKFQFQSIRVAK